MVSPTCNRHITFGLCNSENLDSGKALVEASKNRLQELKRSFSASSHPSGDLRVEQSVTTLFPVCLQSPRPRPALAPMQLCVTEVWA